MLLKAVELAKKNPIKGLPRLSALIYDKKRLVAVGYNSLTTHPLQARFRSHPSRIHLHAEVAAIVAAKQNVEGMTMYVARVLKNNEPALAMPCIDCQRALAAFNLKDVFWTT